MSIVSRSVPIYRTRDPDFWWPSTLESRWPSYHRTLPYNTFDDVVPYEFERRPLTASQMWSSFENEMRRMVDALKPNTWDSSFWDMSPRTDNSRLMDRIIPSVDNWRLTENFRMDNPIQEDYNGTRKFYLEYDMSQFKPEEITVKTSGRELCIFAKHEEKDENHSSRREYARKYLLPEEVDPEMLTSKLSDTGKLTIQAPLPLPALKTGSRDKPAISNSVKHAINNAVVQ